MCRNLNSTLTITIIVWILTNCIVILFKSNRSNFSFFSFEFIKSENHYIIHFSDSDPFFCRTKKIVGNILKQDEFVFLWKYVQRIKLLKLTDKTLIVFLYVCLSWPLFDHWVSIFDTIKRTNSSCLRCRAWGYFRTLKPD